MPNVETMLDLLEGAINVKHKGAVGGDVTADTDGFEAALAELSSTGGVLIIPPSTSDYILGANVFAALGSSQKNICIMWHGGVETDVQQNPKHSILIQGTGRGGSPTSSAGRSGGYLRASSSFPTSGSALLFMGAAGVSSHGVMVRDLLLDGRDLAEYAIISDSMQELSGVEGCFLYKTANGIYCYNSTASSTNYVLRNLEIYLTAGSSGTGVNIYNERGSPVELNRITVNHIDGAFVAGSAGFKLVGYSINGDRLFGESVENVVLIGDTGGTLVTRAIHLRGVSGWTPNVGDINALVLIQTGGLSTDNIVLENVYGDTKADYIIKDDVAGVSFPTSRYGYIERYATRTKEFGIEPASSNVVVDTTAWASHRTETLGAASVDDYDPYSAEYLKLTPYAGGSTIHSILGGVRGRSLTIINMGSDNLVLDHQAGSGTAGFRLWSTTGADITLTQYQAARLSHGLGNSAYWLMWPLG